MATLDAGIVNIALPVMSKSMNVDLSSIQWVVTAYLITISLFLLVWGKISDIFGKKYIFVFGFLMFTAGSLSCGFSGTLVMLIISRIAQAVGASAMMALSQGITVYIFPPEQRGKALGIIGTMVAIGSLVGPSLGGMIVNVFSWEAIFFINLPVGILGAALSMIFIPDSFERLKDKSFDFAGTALFSVALLSLFVGMLLVQQGLLPLKYFWPMLALAFICAVLFIRTERKTASPLLHLGLFKKREFSMGLVSAWLAFIAMNSTLLFMPFYLQDELGYSAAGAGLLISFYPVTTAVVAPLSGWLSDKVTYRPLTIAGMSVATGALLLLSSLNDSSPYWFIAFCMVALGSGVALFQSPNNSSVMGSVPKEQLGVAGGINALFRNLGLVSGTTFSVMIFSFVTKLDINDVSAGAGYASGALFMRGFRDVMLFDAACCLIAAFFNISRAVSVRPQRSGDE